MKILGVDERSVLFQLLAGLYLHQLAYTEIMSVDLVKMRYICDSKLGVSGGQGVWHHAHRRAPLPVHVLKNQGRGT